MDHNPVLQRKLSRPRITAANPNQESRQNMSTPYDPTADNMLDEGERIAEQYSDDQYDTEAIEIDARNGNFSEDSVEDYRHENIVRSSLVNGQFSQARKQCESYGLTYELERYKFDNERNS